MAESKAEQIVAALETLLEGIVGDGGTTYWYSPHAVLRFPGFTAQCLDASVGDPATIYVLSPGEETVRPETIGGRMRGDMAIDVTVAQRFNPPTENPFAPPSPDRWKVQNRLLRDAEKRIASDWDLGDLALYTAVEAKDRTAEDTYAEGWAIAFLRVKVQYSYAEATP